MWRFIDELTDEGVETIADLRDATDDELEAIGMGFAHRRRLRNALKEQ